MKPEISIIIVNYNGYFWLEKCLESFQNLREWNRDSKKTAVEVIVVDNGSTDDSAQKTEKNFSWVNLIRTNKNLGFAGGNNVGIQKASAPLIMLLNSDTEFFPQTSLQELLENFAQKDIAVVTPKIVLADGSLDHASHRGFPTPWNALAYFSGVAKYFPSSRLFAGYEMGWEDLSTRHEIDACSGAAMIVRKSAIDEVGLLDESFFMYGEDIDWCFRFKQKGWKVIYDPVMTVLHHKHKSGLGKKGAWETKLRTTEAFYDSMKQFIRKSYGQRYPVFARLVIFAIIDIMKRRKINRERKLYVSE